MNRYNRSLDVSIVIVNWNTQDLLKDCLSSIFKTKNNLNIQIIVIDNNSSDDSREMVKNDFPDVFLVNSGANIGFSKANNLALKYVKSSLVLFLNPDTIVKERALQLLINFINKHPGVGAVGCKATNLEGRTQELGIQWFPSPLKEFFNLMLISDRSLKMFKNIIPYIEPDSSSYVKKLYGLCLLVRKSIIDEIGSFDDRFFMYCEDVDLCRRILDGGWKLYYLSEAEILHIGGGASQASYNSFSTLMMSESIGKLMEKYYGKSGLIQYKFALFTGSLFRIFIILILGSLSYLFRPSNNTFMHHSLAKQITLIRWAINLAKPVVKN